MVRVDYNNAGKVLEKRILARLTKFEPGDPHLREALTRIGIMIERETKKNITKPREPKNLVDTGALLNSIKFKVFKRGSITGVSVGSYAIPYAAVHEFGFSGSVNVASHKRGTSNVSAYNRMMNIRARPYLRPAVKSVRKEIIEIIKGLV